MRILKAIFSILTVAFSAIALAKLLPYDVVLPIVFAFMGLSFLVNAKEYYDNGSKKDAAFFMGLTIFVYAITAVNLISRFI